MEQIPPLEDIGFVGVEFPKRGSFVFHKNNVVSFLSRASKPILHLIDEKEKDDKKKIIQYSFIPEWVEGQFPNSWLTKLNIESLGRKGYLDKAYIDKNFSWFNFGEFQKIISINKYFIQFKGKDKYVEYEYYDERDKVYEFEIDLYIDVAFGLDLENGKSVIFTYSEGSEISTVYIGKKNELREMGVFQLNWLKDEEYMRING